MTAAVHRYGASLATGHAPHVRGDGNLAQRARTLLLALLPCVLIGAHNTGYQTRLALAWLGTTDVAGVADAAGWRGALVRLVGIEFDAASVPGCVLHGLLYLLPLLAVTLSAAAACEYIFARVRHRDRIPGVCATALLFTLCLPATLPLWQAALGIGFGVIVGQEIFGGTGRNVFHPAVTGVVFLYFAFPSSLRSDAVWTAVADFRPMDGVHAAASGGMTLLQDAGTTWWRAFTGHQPGALGNTSALACLVGGALLVHRRIASWRVMVGMALGLTVAVALLPDAPGHSFQGVPWYWHGALGSFAFGTVFLATDPATSASTHAGRWVHGGLVGVLVAVIRVASPVHVEGTLLAILLGSVFAPLIDHAVVAVHVRRRLRHV